MRKKQFKPPPAGQSESDPPEVVEKQKAKEWNSFWDANHITARVHYNLAEEQVKAVWLKAYADSGKRPTWHDLTPKLAFDKSS